MRLRGEIGARSRGDWREIARRLRGGVAARACESVSFCVVLVVTSHMLKPMSERVPAPE